MANLEPNLSPDAAALVSGAVIVALLDRLVALGKLGTGDVKDILTASSIAIQRRTKNNIRDEAERTVINLVNHWSERQV